MREPEREGGAEGQTHCQGESEAGKESRPLLSSRSLGLECGEGCWGPGGQGMPGLQSSDAFAAGSWTQVVLEEFGGEKLKDLACLGRHTHRLLAPPCLDSLLRAVPALLGPLPPQRLSSYLAFCVPARPWPPEPWDRAERFLGAAAAPRSAVAFPFQEESSHALTPPTFSGRAWAWYHVLTKEGAKHGHAGDDKAEDAVGATLDQMDPGAPLEGWVWAQSAGYFLRTRITASYARGEEEGQRGSQRWGRRDQTEPLGTAPGEGAQRRPLSASFLTETCPGGHLCLGPSPSSENTPDLTQSLY
nr:uncharacterized protein LOC111768538 [Equus caballus]